MIFGFLVNMENTKAIYFYSIPKREGVRRRHDPLKNDLRASGFAELPPGPAKLVSQPL